MSAHVVQEASFEEVQKYWQCVDGAAERLWRVLWPILNVEHKTKVEQLGMPFAHLPELEQGLLRHAAAEVLDILEEEKR